MSERDPQLRTSATLSDGSTVSGEAWAVEHAIQFDHDWQAGEAAWVKHLRRCGLKAAHPDDGWVDREANTVRFCYPQFFDNPQVGDLIALGSHTGRGWRVVRLTAKDEPHPIWSALKKGGTHDRCAWLWHFEADNG